ncbi:uncharacterized protein GLRG_07188 [Colletotrichum graminicola M1.001]|uniref:Uncharacterized protein n=1 Tax=Colletotrichum graminicola (strain M1.001 / M2 / FGSC 10212) TaxID=645133 RepID=E3QMF6_COLGM|nr:uncharacterized protein GLRG_07188 [Colletotrichum graminicola M1.001]EFQ32044.1 hypothetical protein GLRG_07188 [Colletotrichum graminicola M1.001]
MSSFTQTVNLEAALRHVCSQRATYSNVDLGERSLQVEMMRGIFGSANLLLAWLDTWNQSLAPGALETIANPNGNRAPKYGYVAADPGVPRTRWVGALGGSTPVQHEPRCRGSKGTTCIASWGFDISTSCPTDYTEATSLGDAHRDFVACWLQDPVPTTRAAKPWTFLCYAGSGLGSHMPTMPSWAPNSHVANLLPDMIAYAMELVYAQEPTMSVPRRAGSPMVRRRETGGFPAEAIYSRGVAVIVADLMDGEARGSVWNREGDPRDAGARLRSRSGLRRTPERNPIRSGVVRQRVSAKPTRQRAQAAAPSLDRDDFTI